MKMNPTLLTDVRLALGVATLLITAVMLMAVFYYGWRVTRFRFYIWPVVTVLVHVIMFQTYIQFFNPSPGPGVVALWSLVLRLHGVLVFGAYSIIMLSAAHRNHYGEHSHE